MTQFTQLGAGNILAPNAVHLLSPIGVDFQSVGQPVAKVLKRASVESYFPIVAHVASECGIADALIDVTGTDF